MGVSKMIYCIGESLYDIIFREGKPEWAVPGGGMLNCAVSLGNAGAEVELITETGNDKVGGMILNFLQESRVGANYLRVSDNNTALALAFLDDRGNADYQFYHTHAENPPEFTVPDFQKGDIMIFGSLYSVNKRNRPNIVKLAMAARNAGAIIIYDPNFRRAHAHQLKELYPVILENISLSDIVRGSDEDFSLIGNSRKGTDIYEMIQNSGCNTLLLTKNIEGVDLFSNDFTDHYDAIPVNIVSTIGAGDSFNAGIAFEIHSLGRLPASDDEWKRVISTGLNFAAEVCASRENYIKKRSI